MVNLLAFAKDKFHLPKDTKPDFSGHTVIITGANTGVGFEAAVKFVQLGAARLILAVRTLSKGEDAKMRIEQRTSRKGVVDVWPLDMLDYASIQTFATRVETELERVDIAVLNAGVVHTAFQRSKYGNEETLQVNVLSTTLLALLLLPKLKQSKTASFTPVLEIIGSSTHCSITSLPEYNTPFAHYNAEKTFGGVEFQYAVSKLFVMYAETGLSELAKDKGQISTYVTTVCPGPTKSDLARDAAQIWYFRIALTLMTALQRQTEEGARTYISGVTQGEALHGGFWKDDTIFKPAPLVGGSKGKDLQTKVWAEIIEALSKDVPEIKQVIERLRSA